MKYSSLESQTELAGVCMMGTRMLVLGWGCHAGVRFGLGLGMLGGHEAIGLGLGMLGGHEAIRLRLVKGAIHLHTYS